MRSLLLFIIVGIYVMSLAKSATADTLAELGHYQVEERDFVFAQINGLDLLARSYRPKTNAEVPAVVEVHGGAWNLYDRIAGQLYNRALASAGVFVLAIDFRQAPQFQHPLASRDVTAAVRYLRVHAQALAIDAKSIGLIGSSSGGHLAALAGIKPNDAMHLGTPIMGAQGQPVLADEISAEVNYVIALWPVSDPLYRYNYAKQSGREQLITAHNNYFVSREIMAEASIAGIIDAGDAIKNLPKLLVVQPGEVKNIPIEMTFALLQSYQRGGGKVEYAYFPGQPHAFAHRPSAATNDCIALMRGFIARQLTVE